VTAVLANTLFLLGATGQRAASAAMILGHWQWRVFATVAFTSLTAECVIERIWLGVAVNGALLALLGVDWWNRRGKRAAKALGARGRAVIAGLLERLRDAVEPVPEGVRA
jgi:hypothetical protein